MATTTQEEKDAVTCGELRAILEERLQETVKTLSGIILSKDVPDAKLAKADGYLKGAVAEAIRELYQLDTWAGLPSLRRILRQR